MTTMMMTTMMMTMLICRRNVLDVAMMLIGMEIAMNVMNVEILFNKYVLALAVTIIAACSDPEVVSAAKSKVSEWFD